MEIIYRTKDGTEFTDVSEAFVHETNLQFKEEEKNGPLYFNGLGDAVDDYNFADFALVRSEDEWDDFYDRISNSGEDYVGDYWDFAGATLLYGRFAHNWVMIHDFCDFSREDANFFFKSAIELVDKYSK